MRDDGDHVSRISAAAGVSASAAAACSSASSLPTGSSLSSTLSSLDMDKFGLHLALELFGPARVMEHIHLQQRHKIHRSQDHRLVPPLYWRSRFFVPDQQHHQYQQEDDEERGAFWLWKALIDISSNGVEDDVECDDDNKRPADEVRNSAVSLLYFDVTFDFSNINALSSSIDTFQPTKSSIGTVQVSFGFFFIDSHNNNDNDDDHRISKAEYIKTDPILCSDLQSHLESMNLDISRPDAGKMLASLMAAEFLRQGSQRGRQGQQKVQRGQKTASSIHVAYPMDLRSSINCNDQMGKSCQQKIVMKILYDKLGTGLLFTTIPNSGNRGVTARTRYTNTQLKHMYHDLVVQNSHYYNANERLRGTTSQTNFDVSASSSMKLSQSDLSSPRSMFSPSPGSAPAATGALNIGATMTGVPNLRAKRKLDMITGIQKSDDVPTHDAMASMTVEEFKLKVVHAFDEWRSQQNPQAAPSSSSSSQSATTRYAKTNDVADQVEASSKPVGKSNSSIVSNGTEEKKCGKNMASGSEQAAAATTRPLIILKKQKPQRRRYAR